MKAPYRAASDRRRYANNICYAIDLWAHGGESEEEHTTTEDGGACIWEWDDTKARDSFAKLVVYGPMAQDLRVQGICPFCLYIDISGCFPEELVEFRDRPPMEYTDRELKSTVRESSVNMGWLEAAAVAHNREMHAENGNIDTTHDNHHERTGLLRYLHEQFWDSVNL